MILNRLNEMLEEKTEDIKFDTSDNAIRSKMYELWLPEDEKSGIPDEDIPYFGKDTPISGINQRVMTLLIRTKKSNNGENDVNTHIQSVLERNKSSTIVAEQPREHTFVEKVKVEDVKIEKINHSSFHDDTSGEVIPDFSSARASHQSLGKYYVNQQNYNGKQTSLDFWML